MKPPKIFFTHKKGNFSGVSFSNETVICTAFDSKSEARKCGAQRRDTLMDEP